MALLLNSYSLCFSDKCTLSITPADEAEIVLSTRDINKLTRGDIIDAPISTYLFNNEVYWILPTAMQQNSMVYLSHTILKGRELDKSEIVGIYNQNKLFKNSPNAITSTKGYKWITNTYQNEHGVLAFIHVEYAGEKDYWGMPCITTSDGRKKCAPGQSKIGLAWMETPKNFSGVPEFTFLGFIAGYSGNIAHFNVQGTPYSIVREEGIDYLNIWFADKNNFYKSMNVARARAPLNDVITAARNGMTIKWKKYNNGAWEDALKGKSSSALPEVRGVEGVDQRVARGNVFVHSDVVKHVESGKYFLCAYTLESEKEPSSLVFYESCNCIDWELNTIANPTRENRPKCGWSYMTFIDDNGTDNGMASGTFTLLVGYDYGGPKRHVAKFRIAVSDSCSCNTKN